MDSWDAQQLFLKTLYSLNLCRLYLRVQQLYDIVTNDGLKIQECYLSVTKINKFTHNNWNQQSRSHQVA